MRGLGLLAVIFLVLALERLLGAAMTGSAAGIRTAWMLSAAFALTGAALLFGFFWTCRGASRRLSTAKAKGMRTSGDVE
jgi:hypothetical protein